MSNYRRLISYIYAYEGGIKGKNIGFAKIEARNGQCKIQVSVKKVYVGNNDMGVYLLAGNDQILLGRIFIRNGAGEFRAVVPMGNVEHSGWSMDQCYGLTIHSVEDSWQSYTTIWDDAVTQAAELQPGEPVELDTVERAAHVELGDVTAEKLEVEQMAQIPNASISEADVNQMEKDHKSSIVEEIEAEIQAQSQADEQEAKEIQDAQEWKRAQAVQQMQKEQEIERMEPEQTVQPQEQNEGEMPAAEIPQPIMENQILRPNAGASQVPPAQNQRWQNQMSKPVPPVQARRAQAPQIQPRRTQAVSQPQPSQDQKFQNQVQKNQMAQPRMDSQSQLSQDQTFQNQMAQLRMDSQSQLSQEQIFQSQMAQPQMDSQSQPSQDQTFQSQMQQNQMTQPSQAQMQLSQSQTQGNSASGNRPSPDQPPVEMEAWELFNRMEKEEKDASQPDRLWQHFRKTYPKIQAFDYVNGCEILMIKPQDIGLLPREIWTYGNNSFLLHGYYSFRYLILVKLNNPQGTPRYLLGVPGHYYSNEKYMASMFGFPNFVLSKSQPAGDERFGYWYTDINMGNQ